MGTDGVMAFCTSCKCERPFRKHPVNHLLHLLITVLTGGFWLVPWLAIYVDREFRPWRCKVCGWHKPEFRVAVQDVVNMGEAALQGSRRRSAIRVLQRDYATSPLIKRK